MLAMTCAVLMACDPPVVPIEHPPHVFEMQGVTITSSEGGSWTYVMQAAKAFGNRTHVKLSSIELDGQSKPHSPTEPPNTLTATVPKGTFDMKKQGGLLTGGIKAEINQQYQVTTKSARMKGSHIRTKDTVTIKGPTLHMTLEGAHIDTERKQFESLGQASGVFLAPTATPQ